MTRSANRADASETQAAPDPRLCGSGPYYRIAAVRCPWGDAMVTPTMRAQEWNPDVAEQALVDLRHRSLAWIELAYGDAMHVVAGVLRGMFNASKL